MTLRPSRETASRIALLGLAQEQSFDEGRMGAEDDVHRMCDDIDGASQSTDY
jgi:hypothetical protein